MTLTYEAKLSPERVIPLAIVGCGSVARWKHLPALTEGVPELRIVALCDRDEDLMNALGDHYRIERRYTDAAKMIADGDVEAVDINAGHVVNEALIPMFAEAGKHIFAEKPIAASLETAKQLRDITADAGIVFQIGHMKRLYYAYREAKQLMDDGALGNTTALQSRMWWDLEPYPQMLFNNGIHHIDLVQYFMG
ncbi:MAG: Gfo/Idh/MocA family oxidoreductase, partial [Candidatus Latescibacteria bacterium]|nr:Gfo/Idh/MocA family oxidoreductase [Candidatus Latescibacterota bacterium]